MGKFIGDVKTQWINDGKRMVLLSSFSFIDSKGKKWTANKGTVIDGASIPRIFWRIIGSPYRGKYRKASIIHDAFCNYKTESKIDTDIMFFQAMLTSKVPKWKAFAMYQAVKIFSKKW